MRRRELKQVDRLLRVEEEEAREKQLSLKKEADETKERVFERRGWEQSMLKESVRRSDG